MNKEEFDSLLDGFNKFADNLGNDFKSEEKPQHFILIPPEQKEMAREQGAKWDREKGSHYVFTSNFEDHPLRTYGYDRYIRVVLPNELSFDQKKAAEEQLKQLGVLKRTDLRGEWSLFIHADGSSVEVLESLVMRGWTGGLGDE